METQEYTSKNTNFSPGFDIVAIAVSADGLKALSQIFSTLSADFPVPIVLVKHLAAEYRSYLAEILGRTTSLTVKQAEDGEEIHRGAIYIAAPNYHLVVKRGSLALTQTAKIHFSRPSADVLFQSVAESYKERSLAVVLTGGDSDGAQGVQAIKKMGGVVIAQDRETSKVFGMPAAAIATGCVDYILPLNEIAGAIANLVMTGGIA